MAIRNDFTAGEVLAAADLNDTFASKVPYAYGTATPSTTVEGFIWFDEATTPPTAKVWDGAAFQAISAPSGLVHVATESFSAVSSVSLNGVFTSTYVNYRVQINFTGSAGDVLQMRLRAAGSDLSTSYYGSVINAQNNNTTLGNTNTTNGTSWGLSFSPSSLSAATIDIMDPVVTAKTIFYGFGINPDTTGNLRIVGGFNNNSTSYDGLTIFPASGTITGTIRVYGYQNS